MSQKWKLILAFTMGMAVSQLSADPTDFLFFSRASKGALSPFEQVFYWYVLPAAFYFMLFIIAYIMSRTGLMKPVHFVYLMMGIALYGAYRSFFALGGVWNIVTGVAMAAAALAFGLLLGLRRQVE